MKLFVSFNFRSRLYHQIYRLEFPLQKSKNNLYEVVSILSGPGRPETFWKSYFPLLHKAHHVLKDKSITRHLNHLGRKVRNNSVKCLVTFSQFKRRRKHFLWDIFEIKLNGIAEQIEKSKEESLVQEFVPYLNF